MTIKFNTNDILKTKKAFHVKALHEKILKVFFINLKGLPMKEMEHIFVGSLESDFKD